AAGVSVLFVQAVDQDDYLYLSDEREGLGVVWDVAHDEFEIEEKIQLLISKRTRENKEEVERCARFYKESFFHPPTVENITNALDIYD
ncbi:MAG: hypothetical protein HQK51_21795, partial [Oligoflexia bacterium]|nr:hypothetical protein [Oligoflexia bacterium]